MACGFRESGIGSNNLVGIRISLKLDAPLGYLDTSTGRIHTLVGEDYVRELDHMTRTRFSENFRRRDQLTERIKRVFFTDDGVSIPAAAASAGAGSGSGAGAGKGSSKAADEKEARRELKRREGLRRQAEVQAAKLAAAVADDKSMLD